MRRVLLIFNRSSGRNRNLREKQISHALEVFRSAGVAVEAQPTTGAGSAVTQAQQAASAGFDTVVACGGDGTANEVLNGLILSGSPAALGVLPFGSGNLLATDLRLPHHAEAAARALLQYKPRSLHPGVITFHGPSGSQKRYFIVAAGIGCDAELMYRTAVEAKGRYGMYAYFLGMLRMTFQGNFPMFHVEWQDEQGARQETDVSLVLAVRATRFPGLLSRMRLGAELLRNDCRVLLFRTNKVRHFLNYFFSVATGINWKVSAVDLVSSKWLRCTALAPKEGSSGPAKTPQKIHCEVDGELLGTLPVEVSIGEETFNLLMPD